MLTDDPVPTTPVRFRVPIRCPLCDALGSVTPETTISGGVLKLMWCCRACSREWPITRGERELIERRDNKPDRRRVTRKDRREK